MIRDYYCAIISQNCKLIFFDTIKAINMKSISRATELLEKTP